RRSHGASCKSRLNKRRPSRCRDGSEENDGPRRKGRSKNKRRLHQSGRSSNKAFQKQSPARGGRSLIIFDGPL
ncbi:hypothetical protein AVEN_190254-1, partial [Araneus ventricosus]